MVKIMFKIHNFFKKNKTTAAENSSLPTAKQAATTAGLPYVAINAFHIDPTNLHQGSFELDWNDKFIADLIRAGYQLRKDDTDAEIVDRWFQTICRHVVMETWEQEQAMQNNGFTSKKNLGNGRSEIS